MINRKLQLSIISVLVICLVLFSSYGSLFGTVQKPKKSEAVALPVVFGVITAVVSVVQLSINIGDRTAKTFTRANAEAIEEKLVELAKADNNYDALMQQVANAMPNYPSPVPFIPTALSGLTLNEMYNAVVAVLYPDYPAINTDCKYFLRKTGNIVAYGKKSTDVIPYGGWTTFSDGSGLAYPWQIYDKYSFNTYTSYIQLYDCTTNQLLHAYDYYMYAVSSRLTGFVGTDYYYSLPYSVGGKMPTDINDTNAAYYYFALLVGWFDQNEITYAGGTEQKVNNLKTYPMPATIPEDTMTAIKNGDADIPINNFANITYDNSTNIWTFDPDAYVLIDKSATPTVTPTPSPSPTVVPDPTPTATDGDGNTNGWLQAIYKKLVAIDATLKTYWAQLFKDLNIVNDHLKNMIANGGTGIDADGDGADDGIVGNLTSGFKAFLEFLRSALVPTLKLNLDDLNTMPDNIWQKFPFSLASDIVRLFTIFEAEPKPLYYSTNFDISMLGVAPIPLVIDFSVFAQYAPIVRNLFFISFLISLAWITFFMFHGSGGNE